MPKNFHVFSEIFLHITGHCLESHPMITDAAELLPYQFIKDYIRRTDGVYLKGVGGTSDHVHLAIQIEPFITPSELVGKIKGSASHELYERLGKDFIRWQRGYGVVSFAKRHLGAVTRYIVNQKERHRQGTIREALERMNAKSRRKWLKPDSREEAGWEN
ncbi:MAG: transposase [bacterium]|nr:transposase [bacterium]